MLNTETASWHYPNLWISSQYISQWAASHKGISVKAVVRQNLNELRFESNLLKNESLIEQ